MDDVIDDTKLHGDSLLSAGCLGPASPTYRAARVTPAERPRSRPT
jgi:hypothetical protein